MMQLITAEYYGNFTDEIAEMHRLRYRVFRERLDWEVHVSGDMEIDGFDALQPCYLLQRAFIGLIQGCVRLLPSIGPIMLADTFPVLLDGACAPASPTIWGKQPLCARYSCRRTQGSSWPTSFLLA